MDGGGSKGWEVSSKRDLSGQRFVYLWADGIYSNVRLDDERQCLLVVIGALEDGRKQLLAVHDASFATMFTDNHMGEAFPHW